MPDVSDQAEIVRRFIAIPNDKKRIFLQRLAGKGVDFRSLPIPSGAARDGTLPLSFAQSRLWFLWRLEPESVAYNIPVVIRMRGALDEASLSRSLASIVARHEILRTTFAIQEDGTAVQRIHAPGPMVVARIDLSNVAAVEREPRAQRLAEEEARRPFDLVEGPLLRVTLLHLAGDDHLLLLTMHHIVSDAWSIDRLIAEFSRLYGGREVLPALPIQYVDYAVWQRAWLNGGEGERQLVYWRTKLGAEHLVLELPSDRPRPPVQSHRGATHKLEVGPALTTRLRNFAQARRATPFTVMLAAFKALLFRYTGQQDIRIGVPVANRGQRETEPLIGFFVNTLALRTVLDGEASFEVLVASVRGTILDGQAHQDLPFERLVEVLNPERSQSYNPLFQVLMNHVRDDRAQQRWQLPGLAAEIVQIPEQTTQVDLALYVVEHEDDMTVDLGYATDLFDGATIARLGEYWLSLLDDALARPAAVLNELRLMTLGQRSQIMELGAGGHRPVPAVCLHELIEQQVSRTPDAVAVIFEGQRLSYEELNRRANRLAHFLRGAGVGPDTVVAICAERSLEMVVGLLGILKAGGAYLPIDPDYPDERIAYMLQDANPPVLLTQAKLVAKLPPSRARVFALDRDWASLADQPDSNLDPQALGLTPRHLAYVIYTSGSTGQPKGAMNEHRGIVNRLQWMQDEYRLGAGDRVLQKTPFSFDVSVWEFFWPLMVGACLVEARPQGHQDPDYLKQLMQETGITVAHFVPSMLQAFLEQGDLVRCQGLRHIVCSGEELPLSLQNRCLERLPQTQLNNLYGPTEAAVDVTYWQCRLDSDLNRVPIGRPIANIQIYILDAQLQPVPLGVSGEIYIGGNGVARGYLHRPELTAERFVRSPFSDDPDARLYKTGDLGRWRPDGAIEYLGRNDFQVKIRGFRIELGEIEAQLLSYDGVREAVVTARETPHGKQLVGYVTGSDDGTLEDSLRAHLKAGLPDYMVPSRVVVLERLPLSPNGKLDRKALPEPGWPEQQEEYAAPRTLLEQQLTDIWQEVLGVPQVGITDDFFALGGHSLLVLKLAAAIEAELGRRIPVASIFDAPTIAKLAAVIDNEHHEENWKHLVVLQRGGRRHKPLFCLHGFDGGLKDYLNLVHFLSASLPVYGLSAGLQEDQEISSDILSALTDVYVQEIRSLQPEGPYRICGFSFGGSPAFELATRLANAGENVTLILLDAYAYSASVKAVSWFHGFVKMVQTREIVLTVKVKLWRLFFYHMHYWLTGKDRDLIHGLIRQEQKRKYTSFVGRAILFKSTSQDNSDDITIEFDGRNGWSKYIEGPFDVIEVEAGHVGLIMEPAVKIVAARLNDLLMKD